MTRSAWCSWAANTPDWLSMASTSVVLPWSTWAMMATLRMSVRAGMGGSRVAGVWRRWALAGLVVAAFPVGAGDSAAAGHSLSIAWVGDMALSSHYGLPPGGGLSHVRRVLRAPD